MAQTRLDDSPMMLRSRTRRGLLACLAVLAAYGLMWGLVPERAFKVGGPASALQTDFLFLIPLLWITFAVFGRAERAPRDEEVTT